MYTFYRKTVEGLSPLTENELELKENIKNEFLYGRTYSYIKIINDDIILSQNDYLKDWELNELRFVPNKGLFGGCVAKKVDINFNNVGKQFSIQDKEFELYLGVKYNNEEFYIKYGTFIVQHPETEDVTDNTSFTALDYMTKFNQIYVDRIKYPCTLRELTEDICNQAGGVILSEEKFRNEDFIVENNQFVNGENLRQVLQGIALSAFSWARIDENNELHFDLNQKEDIDIELTPNEYYNLSKDDYIYGPINRIIIRDSQIEGENVTIDDEESILENQINELVIEDNPFAYTQEKREQLIEAARELFGFKYMPINEASLIGFAFLNSKDKIRFNILDGEVFDTYLFDHKVKYNGTVLDSMQSKALTKTETKYVYKPELSEKIKRTEIIVDKQEGKITQLAQETTERIEQVQEQTNINTDEIAKLGATETVEGTYLTVNASNNPAKLYCYGNTEQETRSGKNKFNVAELYNSAAIISVEKSSFDLSTTWAGTIINAKDVIKNLEPNTTYITTAKVTTISRPTTLSGSNHYNILTLYNGTQSLSILYDKNKQSRALNTTEEIQTTFTTPSDLTNFKILGYSYHGNNDGSTTYTASGQIKIENLMIRKATETDDTFEPYGVMPSPDYPSDIRNVGDNIQLFDKTTVTKGYYVSSTGELVASAGVSVSDFISVIPEEYYTYQGTKIYYNWASKMAFYNKNKEFISYLNIILDGTTIKIPKEVYYLRTTVRNVDLDIYKIEKGKISTSYTEYGCGSIDVKIKNLNELTSFEEGETDYFASLTDKTNSSTDYWKSTPLKDNWVHMECDVTGATTTQRYINVFRAPKTIPNLKPNTTYTIVLEFRNVNITKMSSSLLIGKTGSSNDFFTGMLTISSSAILNNNEKMGKYLLHTMETMSGNYVFRDFHTINQGDKFSYDYRMSVIEGDYRDIDYTYQEFQEQIVSFPLAEGQLLHKGDYLAEDGIHQVKQTLILNGTEEINTIGYIGDNVRFSIEGIVNNFILTNEEICSHLKYLYNYTADEEHFYMGTSGSIWLFINSSIAPTKEALQAYLAEKYANGTPVTIEYELAEEVVIPYTPEQQKVLDSIETFKGINHIYCIDEIEPEKIILTYYPNTPYNDTLVNKDTFDKVTTEMNAEFNIRANEVETSVREQTTASIMTLLNNNYLTGEQVNALVEGNAEDIATVKEQLTQTVTSSQMQIEITKAIEGGVSYLKNTLFTIDENGMWIATKQDPFSALYNNTGMKLYSYEEMIARFDVDGATVQGNLNLNGELITPNLRMMNVDVNGVPHTHIHWIGG